MAKYNIYQVRRAKASDLNAKLTSCGFDEVSSRKCGDYKLTVFFTKDPHPTEIWWLTQFATFFVDFQKMRNRVYSAAVVAENTKTHSVFLIALGRTHFYAQEYIDYSFGLKVAERIGSDNGAKSKSSKHFAGQTTKSVISFSGDSVLSFTPGEATDYVKLKASDSKTWGKSYIHFGTSVQFGSIDYLPANLNILLDNLERSLKRKPIFSLPRIVPIKDDAQVAQLDSEVIGAITGNDEAKLSIVDFELYGVDFIFSQQTHVRLECGRLQSDNIGELDLVAVKKFTEDNNLNLEDVLRDIKVKVFVNESSKFTTKLINLLDYVGDGEYFLHRGKWYIFSQTFLDNLTTLLSSISTEKISMQFSASELRSWQDAHKDDKGMLKYRERYVIDKIVQQDKSLKDWDRELDHKNVNGKKVKMEVSDIYDPRNGEINVIKIGEAKDFGYAFDQAALTLNFTRSNKYTKQDGSTIEVKRLKLTLVTPNVKIPEDANDVNSLSFKIKLGELANLAREKGVDFTIAFARYSKT